MASNQISRIELKQLIFDQLFETHTETEVNAKAATATKSIDHYLKPFVKNNFSWMQCCGFLLDRVKKFTYFAVNSDKKQQSTTQKQKKKHVTSITTMIIPFRGIQVT